MTYILFVDGLGVPRLFCLMVEVRAAAMDVDTEYVRSRAPKVVNIR
jgi:hypothetical protein